MPQLVRAALLIGAALCVVASAAPCAVASAAPCAVAVSPAVTRGASYYASLRLTPGCPPGTAVRVRKSSTLNTRAGGARYQPIEPDGSPEHGRLFSWTLTARGSNIPPAERWTLFTWEWQYLDTSIWNTRTHAFGVWKSAVSP